MNLTIAPTIEAAIRDICDHFPCSSVPIIGQDAVGVWVRIDDVEPGGAWAQGTTFVVVHLASTLPFADIYPVFVRGDLSRADGLPLRPPVTPGHLAGAPGAQDPAVQLSRRTRGDASRQTAGQKITKVMSWLRELP